MPKERTPLKKGRSCSTCSKRKVRCDAVRPACGACLKTAIFRKKDLSTIVCTYKDSKQAAEVVNEAVPKLKSEIEPIKEEEEVLVAKKRDLPQIPINSSPKSINSSSLKRLDPPFSTLLHSSYPSRALNTSANSTHSSRSNSNSLRVSTSLYQNSTPEAYHHPALETYHFPAHPVTSPRLMSNLPALGILARRKSTIMKIELPTAIIIPPVLILGSPVPSELYHQKQNLEMERKEAERRRIQAQQEHDSIKAMKLLPPLVSERSTFTHLPFPNLISNSRSMDLLPQSRYRLTPVATDPNPHPSTSYLSSTPLLHSDTLSIFDSNHSNSFPQPPKPYQRLPSFSEHFSNPSTYAYRPYMPQRTGSVDIFLTEIPTPWIVGNGFQFIRRDEEW